MKKEPNAEFANKQEVAEVKPALSPPKGLDTDKAKQRGPKAEKEQLTLRIDKELIRLVDDYMKNARSPLRITDIVERGVELALREYDRQLPPVTHQVRFLVANTTRIQQDHIRNFMTFLVQDELGEPISAREKNVRDFILGYLKTFASRYKDAQELYRRYGKTDEEFAEIVG
jgi:hypothetical protein